jgi:hypothetical protein
VSDLEALADDIADIERRISDAVFAAVRAQMRNEGDEAARDLEKRLARARRSLVKAEALLRGLGEAD